jgi:uncharacterized protein with PIN domain
MGSQINIRFHDELNDFLISNQRNIEFNHPLNSSRSIKDLVESIGVPHTEIDLIIVNGKSVNFDYLVVTNDHIDLYAPSKYIAPELAAISPLIHCQPEPLANPRFILDVHLGRLAAYLRMMGFDCLYRNDYDDPTLADVSASEQRILLTCDRLLLMRKQVIHGYFVRSRQPREQLLEVLTRFELFDKLKPFTRCMHCNGMTQPVSKHEIEAHLLPATKKYYDEFYQCQNCNKIYWKGSHYLKMQKLINQLKSGSA